MKTTERCAATRVARPLISEEVPDGIVQVPREHDIRIAERAVTISGGKRTTYRRRRSASSDQVLGILLVLGAAPREIKESKTDKEPLPGGVGWPEDDDHDAVGRKIVEAANGAVDEATGRHLADTYGTRGMEVARRVAQEPALGARIVPDGNDVLAQVDFAVDEEMATTLCDVLMRRTQIFLKDRDQGLGCCDTVARRMAKKLGWDEARTTQELASYEAEVGRSREWRAGLTPEKTPS